MNEPSLDLYWIPLGAGASVVRFSGRAYERALALRQKRQPSPLFHSALVAHTDDGRHVIEMTPVPPGGRADERGVVAGGAVGTTLLGGLRVFRYEIRQWRNGVIPDIGWAVASPIHLTNDRATVSELLERVPLVPTLVWGRDALHVHDMWNSNSVIAWLLAQVDLVDAAGAPPTGGRAPGWRAGVIAASRSTTNR